MKTRKRSRSGQSRKRLRAVGNGVAERPTSPPRTFYDPIRKCVVDSKGNTVTLAPVEPTVEHVLAAQRAQDMTRHPAALAAEMQLDACEEADEATVLHLAAVAGVTVAVLEGMRNDYRRTTVDGRAKQAACPTHAPGRKRCWKCPHWDFTDDTPF